jgi:beta-phosphoglucomutase-like phosphatase (HAD superfamily)
MCCVLFDLDGTLYDSPEYSDRLETEVVRFVSERLALGESETKELFGQRRKRLGTLTRTIQSFGMDRNAFFDAMAARIEPSHHYFCGSDGSRRLRLAQTERIQAGIGLE